jgi:PAS domain S-box-containing protein
MTSTEHRGPGTGHPVPDAGPMLSSVNSVLSLSLILAQASTPAQAMRLVTTAVPSIAAGRSAVAWHPSQAGEYYERAPDHVGELLTGLTAVARLTVDGSPVCWAFPIASPLTGGEQVFLVVSGRVELSEQEVFLLSVLAQLCGTVIASQELISTLAKRMDIHRALTAIVASGGQAGIAATLHQLTGYPVLIADVAGNTRAIAGQGTADHRLLNGEAADGEAADAQARWAEVVASLRTAPRATFYQGAWLMPAMPQADVLSVIALVDPARAATETDLAALEHAATVLSVELARLRSVSEAELRGNADREREVAETRAAVSAVSEARQRAILEAALDAVISIDRDARVTYVNSAFETTFGYLAEEVIGCDLAEMIVPPLLREQHRRGLARYLETGQEVILNRRIEMSAMRADGTEFPAEVAVTRTGLPGEPSFTAYVRDITDRQRAEQELIASRARLVAASDAARQRVTRDLHDGAQQQLVASLINLQLAEQRWDSAPQRARELMGQALQDTRRGIEDLRELAAGLHPAILTQHGLAPAVRALADRVPIPVEIDVPGIRLPAPIEASLYFFCSEALTNIAKHAQASCAWVRLEVTADHYVAEVRDDGIGGAHSRPDTSGLIGLSDRIGALSGTLSITSPRTGGTVLRVAVPIPPGS